ncbi:MAG TPA: flagellar basal body rod protein FlgB [Phenylobacterium sp.]
MNLGDIPLFSMLKSRLGYLTERQRLISQNVANSDTPGYRPQDLKPFGFSAQIAAAHGASGADQPARTNKAHLSGTVRRPAGARAVEGRDSEITLDGNAVSLEEQMLKMGEAKMNYDAAIGFYQKSLGMIRMAARSPR